LPAGVPLAEGLLGGKTQSVPDYNFGQRNDDIILCDGEEKKSE